MEILVILFVALVVYVLYRKLNKKADEAFGEQESPVVPEPVVETVLEEAKVAAVTNQKEKKSRKKASSASGGKKSVKKINSAEKEK
jgi:hypothetical protein